MCFRLYAVTAYVVLQKQIFHVSPFEVAGMQHFGQAACYAIYVYSMTVQG